MAPACLHRRSGPRGLRAPAERVRPECTQVRRIGILTGGDAATWAAGVVVGSSRFIVGQPRRTTDLAARSRPPAIYEFPFFVEAGGLISYGANDVEIRRLAASFADKLLKGARPADLPVEQANKFEMVVDLETAEALGLTFPPSLALRMDRMIESRRRLPAATGASYGVGGGGTAGGI